MKQYILSFFLLIFSITMLHGQHKVETLDGQWNFQLDKDSIGWKSWQNKLPDGKTVSVPHTWNVEDGTENYFGTAWYEKNVNIPVEWKSKQVRLHFEAVNRDAVIYVNGKKVGENIGSGYTPFSFDITKFLKFGTDNRITLSISNRYSSYALPYERSFDWPNDGGIIRPVNLIITGKPSVRYAHIKPEINFSDLSATASINVKTWEENVKKADFTFTFAEYESGKILFTKKVELDAKNGIFSTDVNFENIKLWHFDSPNLYTMKVDIAVKGQTTDSYNTRFGFRKVEIRGHQFFLNEEAVRLPGAEYMPGSYPKYGLAEPLEILTEAVELLKDLNCVITRFHWQQDPRILDLMDEKGILVQQEIPWWQKPANLTPELEVLAKKHIDVMIERDFNRPSSFSWGVSNEVNGNTDRSIYTRLIDHARAWNSNAFVAVISNKIDQRLERDESLLADIPTWNDYIGTWHGKAREETPGKLQLINERALKGRPLLITEHGLCEPRFVGADARRVIEMAYHYDQWAKNDYVMGCIYFSLNDYRTQMGESGEGRYKQRVHGLTDAWFGKKPSYAVYKGLASPVYFEWVKQKAKGTEAEVSIYVKNDLPCYILRDYKLVWETADGTISEIVFPEMIPGKKYNAAINNLDPEKKPVVKLIRPTGYVVAEY